MLLQTLVVYSAAVAAAILLSEALASHRFRWEKKSEAPLRSTVKDRNFFGKSDELEERYFWESEEFRFYGFEQHKLEALEQYGDKLQERKLELLERSARKRFLRLVLGLIGIRDEQLTLELERIKRSESKLAREKERATSAI